MAAVTSVHGVTWVWGIGNDEHRYTHYQTHAEEERPPEVVRVLYAVKVVRQTMQLTQRFFLHTNNVKVYTMELL